MSFVRDSSGDIMHYDDPETVFTDTTILGYGMTVYDNTGTGIGKAGPIVNNTFYLNKPLYGFEDKNQYNGLTTNHTYNLVFSINQTPSNGDLAFDKDGNLIEGVYFTDSTHIYDPTSFQTGTFVFEVVNLGSTLNFTPSSIGWTLVVTETGDCNPGGGETVYAVDSSSLNQVILRRVGYLFALPLLTVTPNTWYPGNGSTVGQGTLVFHKSITRVQIHVNTYTNSPVQSYTNCTIISQNSTDIIIEPIDKSIPVTLSYYGNF